MILILRVLGSFLDLPEHLFFTGVFCGGATGVSAGLCRNMSDI